MDEALRTLIERCWRKAPRDEAAWQQFVALTQKPILAWVCQHYTRERSEAAAHASDIRQGVYERLNDTLGDFDAEKGSFWTWLHWEVRAVVKDELDRVSAGKRRPASGHLESLEDIAAQGHETIAGEVSSPHESLSEAERNLAIAQALQTLCTVGCQYTPGFVAKLTSRQVGCPPCRCQQLIETRFFHNEKPKQIAARLRMKSNSVSARLSGCMAALREHVHRQYPDLKEYLK